MKQSHQKYILNAIRTKSAKEIAAELGIREKRIRKFLEKQRKNKERATPADKERAEKPHDKAAVILSIAVIIILGLVVYANSIDGKFIWDDDPLIKDNSLIMNGWPNVLRVFTTTIGTGVNEKSDFYRPIQMLTYFIDHSIYGLDVRGYHITSILIHIFVSLSVYWLATILSKDRLLSFLAGVLFVVYPVHTEVVSYISCRADSLSAFFMFLAMIFYIKRLASKNIVLYILMLLSYAAAVFSKENSLILIPLMLLYHFAFREKPSITGILSLAGVSIIYLFCRMAVLGPPPPHTAQSTTLLERLPGAFVALTNYIRLMLLPFGLHMGYGRGLFSVAEPRAIIGIFTLLAFIFFAVQQRKHGLIFFSITWFIVTLLPVSNIYPVNAYMSENWLYIPSFGFFLVLAKILSGIYSMKDFKVISAGMIAGLAIFYSFLTIQQNKYWAEPMTFYERTLKYAPDNPDITYNLAIIYKNIGRKEDAVKLFKQTIDNNPRHSAAYNNLGNIYSDMGRNEEAVEAYKKALNITPDLSAAYNNLGAAYYAIGRTADAIGAYTKAIEKDPRLVAAYNNLGVIYNAQNDRGKAIELYKKAIEIEPNFVDGYCNLGIAYRAVGKNDEAKAAFKKALGINPGQPDALRNLEDLERSE